jgi:xanthine dehydrogenase YagR molybdenum-binding subunit
VAEDPETARFAASLIRIDYHQRTHTTDLKENRGRARAVRENGESHSHRRGNAARAFDRSPIRIEVEYQMPVEHHNPMEMFGATAIWEGDGRITVYDKTQGPLNCRNYVANVFAMSQHTVRVLSLCRGRFRIGLASAI